jgi:hypothetical protein|tara:strand:+ start:545 stop:700 length:156 start_codon:yes stop_codon:yes gene_type:complete
MNKKKKNNRNRINPEVIQWNKTARKQPRPVPLWKIDLFKIVSRNETKIIKE